MNVYNTAVLYVFLTGINIISEFGTVQSEAKSLFSATKALVIPTRNLSKFVQEFIGEGCYLKGGLPCGDDDESSPEMFSLENILQRSAGK